MNNNESKSELTAEEFLNTKYGDKVKYLNDVLSVKNVIEDMEEYHNSKTSGVRDIEKLKEKFRNDWRDDTEFDEKSWLHVFNWFLPHLQSKGEGVVTDENMRTIKTNLTDLLIRFEFNSYDNDAELEADLDKIISVFKPFLSRPQLPDTTKEAVKPISEIKDKLISFKDWYDKLQPHQKTSVWSDDGQSNGLITMNSERLVTKYLETNNS